MNLHGVVRGAIGAVNPDIQATLLQSAGYTTAGDGTRTPAFTTTTGNIQVQAASGRDIERMNALGVQGVLRSVYLFGLWSGIVRADQKGGDILQFPEQPGAPAKSWKVVNVAETWAGWSRVIVVLQTV